MCARIRQSVGEHNKKREERFSASAKGSASSGSQGSGRQEATLRATPPTGSAQDLITMQEALALNEKAFEFEENEDWKGTRQSVIKNTNPIKEPVKEMKDRVAAVDSRKSKRKNVIKINAGPTVLTGSWL